MKKHIIAAAALSLTAGAAMAQVTIYGTLDESLASINKVDNAGNRNTQLASGVWLPSVFGFSGSEDLGGGLKAIFNLESDLEVDTGRYTGASNSLFRRAATVGLSGGFGTVKLGRQLDMLFLQSFLNNVRLAHSGSAAVVGGLAYGAANANTQSDANIFRNNIISYVSPALGGVTVQAQYGLGETAGNTSGNSYAAIGAGYTGIPNLNINAVYQQAKSAAETTVRDWHLGGKYLMGPVTLAASYTSYRNPGATGTRIDAKAYELGVGYALSPATTAALNYVRFDDKVADAKPDIVTASLKYSLSKRTSVWTMLSRTNGKDKVALYPFYAFGQSTGTATGLAAGVTHQF